MKKMRMEFKLCTIAFLNEMIIHRKNLNYVGIKDSHRFK
jgi:hypothetical protein